MEFIDLEKERAKRGLPPSRQAIKQAIIGEIEKQEQTLRIRASLERINKLMADLKEQAREENKTNGRE